MAKPKKQETPVQGPQDASVIEPSVRINDKEHALEKLFKDGNAPILKSVGIAKIPGTNAFLSYTIHTQGTTVVKIEVEEPNLRDIADEAARTAYVGLFMDQSEEF